MRFVSKYFDDLTTRELYEILKARSAVFVVEQNCVYQDIDGLDPASLHVFFEDEGRIAAYLRAFVKEPGVVQMGRVLTVDRGCGLGGKLLRAGKKKSVRDSIPEKSTSKRRATPSDLREGGLPGDVVCFCLRFPHNRGRSARLLFWLCREPPLCSPSAWQS